MVNEAIGAIWSIEIKEQVRMLSQRHGLAVACKFGKNHHRLSKGVSVVGNAINIGCPLLPIHAIEVNTHTHTHTHLRSGL